MPRRNVSLSLTAFGLSLLIAVFAYQSTDSARTHAQEPAQAQPKASRLKELLAERVAVTQKRLDQTALRIKTASGSVGELFEPTRLALEASLDACETDKERVKVLENFLVKAKENERVAALVAKSGQGRQTEALAATAERLRIEIALERVKTAKGAAPNGDKRKADNKNGADLVGSVEAIESVRVFSRVAGLLKTQKVDLGDRIQRGQVLAVVDAPELQMQAEQDGVALVQTRARLNQAKARVQIASADLETAKAAVTHAEAGAKAAAATVQFREKQWKRFRDLVAQKSVEESVENEGKERYEAAVEANHSAKAAIAAAKSQVISNASKVAQAEAEVATSEADVKMAQLKLDASRQWIALTSIAAPFDGVVTQRNHSVGELIRMTDKEPIVTVQRTDVVRVVTSIPERGVPFVKVGNAVDIEIDALAGKKWAAKVARIGVALDPNTRAMRVEIDLGNPDGQIRPGMFARVSIRDK